MAKTRPEEEEGFDWLKEPAVFCDAFTADYLRATNLVRIAFGEYTDREHYPYYRVSVVLPLDDAKALRSTLNRIIKDSEANKKEDGGTDETTE